MNSRTYETHLAAGYNQGASQYRRDDEIEARTENHQRLGGNLRRICRSFTEPVRVLEIGCGTGRYFHWLENVELLVGVDLSAEMLKQAEQPLLAEEVTARQIRLMQGSVHELEFEPESFDFIYSLGVFGYGTAWTAPLAERIHRWLSPGGRLFFNAIEVPHVPAGMPRLKENVKAKLRPVMPDGVKRWLDSRATVPVVCHTRQSIEAAMDAVGFSDYTISSHACRSSLWNGVHLECLARKQVARVKPVAVRQPDLTSVAA